MRLLVQNHNHQRGLSPQFLAESQYAPSGTSNLFREDAVSSVEHKDEAVEGDGRM